MISTSLALFETRKSAPPLMAKNDPLPFWKNRLWSKIRSQIREEYLFPVEAIRLELGDVDLVFIGRGRQGRRLDQQPVNNCK